MQLSGIVLTTKATGISIREGHYEYFTQRDTVKNEFGIEKTVKKRMERYVPAHEAVMFTCAAPGCGKRNSISILKAKGSVGKDVIVLDCSKCHREHEVSKPPPERPGIIIPGIHIPKNVGLVNPNGSPLTR